MKSNKCFYFINLRGVERKSGIFACFAAHFVGDPKPFPPASSGDLDPQKSPETYLNTTWVSSVRLNWIRMVDATSCVHL